MPDWIAAPARGLSFMALWALIIGWCIGAPVFGLLLSSYLLLHPAQRIFVPLAVIATIYITMRVARALVRLGDSSLEG